MSILYCEFCGEYIDTDFDDEHYLPDGECAEETISKLKNDGLTEEQIDQELEER